MSDMEHGTWVPAEQVSTKLGSYYRMVKATDQLTELEWDAAMEASIEAVVAAGFDSEDSDKLGIAMSDDVQTLLTLAFVRCPELMDQFNGAEAMEYVTALGHPTDCIQCGPAINHFHEYSPPGSPLAGE